MSSYSTLDVKCEDVCETCFFLDIAVRFHGEEEKQRKLGHHSNKNFRPMFQLINKIIYNAFGRNAGEEVACCRTESSDDQPVTEAAESGRADRIIAALRVHKTREDAAAYVSTSRSFESTPITIVDSSQSRSPLQEVSQSNISPRWVRDVWHSDSSIHLSAMPFNANRINSYRMPYALESAIGTNLSSSSTRCSPRTSTLDNLTNVSSDNNETTINEAFSQLKYRKETFQSTNASYSNPLIRNINENRVNTLVPTSQLFRNESKINKLRQLTSPLNNSIQPVMKTSKSDSDIYQSTLLGALFSDTTVNSLSSISHDLIEQETELRSPNLTREDLKCDGSLQLQIPSMKSRDDFNISSGITVIQPLQNNLQSNWSLQTGTISNSVPSENCPDNIIKDIRSNNSGQLASSMSESMNEEIIITAASVARSTVIASQFIRPSPIVGDALPSSTLPLVTMQTSQTENSVLQCLPIPPGSNSISSLSTPSNDNNTIDNTSTKNTDEKTEQVSSNTLEMEVSESNNKIYNSQHESFYLDIDDEYSSSRPMPVDIGESTEDELLEEPPDVHSLRVSLDIKRIVIHKNAENIVHTVNDCGNSDTIHNTVNEPHSTDNNSSPQGQSYIKNCYVTANSKDDKTVMLDSNYKNKNEISVANNKNNKLKGDGKEKRIENNDNDFQTSTVKNKNEESLKNKIKLMQEIISRTHTKDEKNIILNKQKLHKKYDTNDYQTKKKSIRPRHRKKSSSEKSSETAGQDTKAYRTRASDRIQLRSHSKDLSKTEKAESFGSDDKITKAMKRSLINEQVKTKNANNKKKCSSLKLAKYEELFGSNDESSDLTAIDMIRNEFVDSSVTPTIHQKPSKQAIDVKQSIRYEKVSTINHNNTKKKTHQSFGYANNRNKSPQLAKESFPVLYVNVERINMAKIIGDTDRQHSPVKRRRHESRNSNNYYKESDYEQHSEDRSQTKLTNGKKERDISMQKAIKLFAEKKTSFEQSDKDESLSTDNIDAEDYGSMSIETLEQIVKANIMTTPQTNTQEHLEYLPDLFLTAARQKASYDDKYKKSHTKQTHHHKRKMKTKHRSKNAKINNETQSLINLLTDDNFRQMDISHEILADDGKKCVENPITDSHNSIQDSIRLCGFAQLDTTDDTHEKSSFTKVTHLKKSKDKSNKRKEKHFEKSVKKMENIQQASLSSTSSCPFPHLSASDLQVPNNTDRQMSSTENYSEDISEIDLIASYIKSHTTPEEDTFSGEKVAMLPFSNENENISHNTIGYTEPNVKDTTNPEPSKEPTIYPGHFVTISKFPQFNVTDASVNFDLSTWDNQLKNKIYLNIYDMQQNFKSPRGNSFFQSYFDYQRGHNDTNMWDTFLNSDEHENIPMTAWGKADSWAPLTYHPSVNQNWRSEILSNHNSSLVMRNLLNRYTLHDENLWNNQLQAMAIYKVNSNIISVDKNISCNPGHLSKSVAIDENDFSIGNRCFRLYYGNFKPSALNFYGINNLNNWSPKLFINALRMKSDTSLIKFLYKNLNWSATAEERTLWTLNFAPDEIHLWQGGNLVTDININRINDGNLNISQNQIADKGMSHSDKIEISDEEDEDLIQSKSFLKFNLLDDDDTFHCVLVEDAASKNYNKHNKIIFIDDDSNSVEEINLADSLIESKKPSAKVNIVSNADHDNIDNSNTSLHAQSVSSNNCLLAANCSKFVNTNIEQPSLSSDISANNVNNGNIHTLNYNINGTETIQNNESGIFKRPLPLDTSVNDIDEEVLNISSANKALIFSHYNYCRDKMGKKYNSTNISSDSNVPTVSDTSLVNILDLSQNSITILADTQITTAEENGVPLNLTLAEMSIANESDVQLKTEIDTSIKDEDIKYNIEAHVNDTKQAYVSKNDSIFTSFTPKSPKPEIKLENIEIQNSEMTEDEATLDVTNNCIESLTEDIFMKIRNQNLRHSNNSNGNENSEKCQKNDELEDLTSSQTLKRKCPDESSDFEGHTTHLNNNKNSEKESQEIRHKVSLVKFTNITTTKINSAEVTNEQEAISEKEIHTDFENNQEDLDQNADESLNIRSLLDRNNSEDTNERSIADSDDDSTRQGTQESNVASSTIIPVKKPLMTIKKQFTRGMYRRSRVKDMFSDPESDSESKNSSSICEPEGVGSNHSRKDFDRSTKSDRSMSPQISHTLLNKFDDKRYFSSLSSHITDAPKACDIPEPNKVKKSPRNNIGQPTDIKNATQVMDLNKSEAQKCIPNLSSSLRLTRNKNIHIETIIGDKISSAKISSIGVDGEIIPPIKKRRIINRQSEVSQNNCNPAETDKQCGNIPLPVEQPSAYSAQIPDKYFKSTFDEVNINEIPKSVFSAVTLNTAENSISRDTLLPTNKSASKQLNDAVQDNIINSPQNSFDNSTSVTQKSMTTVETLQQNHEKVNSSFPHYPPLPSGLSIRMCNNKTVSPKSIESIQSLSMSYASERTFPPCKNSMTVTQINSPVMSQSMTARTENHSMKNSLSPGIFTEKPEKYTPQILPPRCQTSMPPPTFQNQNRPAHPACQVDAGNSVTWQNNLSEGAIQNRLFTSYNIIPEQAEEVTMNPFANQQVFYPAEILTPSHSAEQMQIESNNREYPLPISQTVFQNTPQGQQPKNTNQQMMSQMQPIPIRPYNNFRMNSLNPSNPMPYHPPQNHPIYPPNTQPSYVPQSNFYHPPTRYAGARYYNYSQIPTLNPEFRYTQRTSYPYKTSQYSAPSVRGSPYNAKRRRGSTRGGAVKNLQ